MTSKQINKATFIEALKVSGCLAKLNILDDIFFLSTDSRTIDKQNIFIALKGESFDGHNFIEQALSKEAKFIVANKNYQNKIYSDKIIYVDDTLQFLAALARTHLQKLKPKTIAITGSNGKTTCKELIKEALMATVGKEKVYASNGNFNNHFGVPLCALDVTEEHEFAIFEMGMNHAQEITHLCEIVQPSFGVITNIAPAHVGNFIDGIDGIQKAKGELFGYLKKNNGTAIVNIDDERVSIEAQGIKNHITFGRAKNSHIRLVNSSYNQELNQQKVLVQTPKEEISFLLSLPGEHNALNASLALAVTYSLELSLTKAAQAIKNISPSKGRFQLKNHKDILIINDGYNANPTSMALGIKTSHSFKSKRRIAVIGSMGELGEHSDKYHLELGARLAKNFDHIFYCGSYAQDIELGAKGEGMKNIVSQENSSLLIAPLKEFIKEGDLLYIKGSLSNNMQLIVDSLESL